MAQAEIVLCSMALCASLVCVLTCSHISNPVFATISTVTGPSIFVLNLIVCGIILLHFC